jgi:hypothetical protein
LSTIIINTLVVTALLLVLGTPLWLVAWRTKRKTTIRNFLIGAGAVGLLIGLLAGASERQVLQCFDAGNSDCVDAGTAGLRLLFIILYVVSAWSAAYLIWKD